MPAAVASSPAGPGSQSVALEGLQLISSSLQDNGWSGGWREGEAGGVAGGEASATGASAQVTDIGSNPGQVLDGPLDTTIKLAETAARPA